MERRHEILAVAKGFIKLERFRDAVEELSRLEPDLGYCDVGFAFMVLSLDRLGAFQLKMNFCRRILVESNFQHSGAWSTLIYHYGSAGRDRVARDLIERAERELPTNADIQYEAARFHTRDGDLRKAWEYLQRSISWDLGKRKWLGIDPDFEALRLYLKRGGS